MSDSERSLTVIGAGSVGRNLAAGARRAGYAVTVGVRDPLTAQSHAPDPGIRYCSPADAVTDAEMVILAVPATALADLVPSLPLAADAVVIDATNAVQTPLPDGFDTLASFVASLVPPGVAVVKAFNTVGAEHMVEGQIDGQALFLPIAGDDAGRPRVHALAEAIGFDAADLGGRDAFRIVEDHARLWIHLAFRCGWGRAFGFASVGR